MRGTSPPSRRASPRVEQQQEDAPRRRHERGEQREEGEQAHDREARGQ
jgi:hypothetical protein